MSMNVNALKQPEPNIVPNNQNSQISKREPVRPNVGVVDVPTISQPTITDVLELKKQENPHTIYKLSEKPKTDLKLHTICSIGVLLGSVLSLVTLFKKG